MELKDVIPPKGFIREYYNFATPLTEAPSKMHITNACVCLAGCVGRNVGLPWGSVTLYPNIYKIDIGKSGVSRKSTANNIARDLIEHVNSGLLLPDYQSMEALLEEMISRPTRIAMIDEFKSFLDNSERTYGQGLRTLITKIWDCPNTYRVGFKNLPADKRVMTNPCLSIAAASTADWIQLQEVDIEGGFWGRFLILRIEDEGRILALPQVASQSEKDRLIKQLTETAKIRGSFAFGPGAQELYEMLYHDHKKSALTDESNSLHSFYSRLDVHVLKIAMLLQLSVDPENLLLTRENIERANTFMEIVREDYRFVAANELSYSREMTERRKVKGLITRNPGITYSRLLRNSHLDAKRVKDAIATLTEAEEIYEQEKQYFPKSSHNSQSVCESTNN